MPILPFETKDLAELPSLQPEGWPDILPHFQYYVATSFCYPNKIVERGKIVAIGTCILHGSSAWLAHIIVHKEHRNKGLGTVMTQELVNQIDRNAYPSVSLIATVLGEPVYAKLGFKKEMDYWMYRNENPTPFQVEDEHLLNVTPSLVPSLLFLDQKVSGEDRAQLLEHHLKGGKVYIKERTLLGFYLPNLNEGPVVAVDKEAGIALLKVRLNKLPKCVVPESNKAGIQFLEENGYELFQKGARMSAGAPLNFKGEGLFGRIGGSLG